MLPLLLSVLACSDAPTVDAVGAAADPAALGRMLTRDLGMPATRVARLDARVGPDCAVVVDPTDPVRCDPSDTCIAIAFSATDGLWFIEALGTAGTLPSEHACIGAAPIPSLPMD